MKVIFCAVCGEPRAVFASGRRILCGKTTCRRDWRNRQRKPEDTARVYARVKRYRARRRAA